VAGLISDRETSDIRFIRNLDSHIVRLQSSHWSGCVIDYIYTITIYLEIILLHRWYCYHPNWTLDKRKIDVLCNWWMTQLHAVQDIGLHTYCRHRLFPCLPASSESSDVLILGRQGIDRRGGHHRGMERSLLQTVARNVDPHRLRVFRRSFAVGFAWSGNSFPAYSTYERLCTFYLVIGYLLQPLHAAVQNCASSSRRLCSFRPSLQVRFRA